jgi:outer membrane protein assembly factor BamB
MTAPQPNRNEARRAQVRKRRLVAVAAGLIVVLVATGAYAMFSGGSTKSTAPANTTPTPAAVPAAPTHVVGTSASWPTFGNTPENTRSATAVNSTLPLRTLWSTDTGRTIELPPVIGNGRVVVGNYGFGVAIDVHSGAILWRHKLGAYVAASPALTGLPGTPTAGQPQRAIFATMAGHVIALDQTTGAQIWNVALGSSVETSPLVLDNGVFVGTRAGQVVRLSLTTGRVVWQNQTGGSVKGAIARDGNDIVYGNYAGSVTALNPATGATVWSNHLGGRFYGAAAVADGRVFIGNTNNSVVALNAATGVTEWTQTTGNYVYSSPAVADGLVFIGSYDSNLYALSTRTGSVVWHHNLGAPISGSPSVIGNLVWIATFGASAATGHTYALDVHTGNLVLVRAPAKYAAPVAVSGLIISTGLTAVTALVPSPAK